jgi:hypothetical protein
MTFCRTMSFQRFLSDSKQTYKLIRDNVMQHNTLYGKTNNRLALKLPSKPSTPPTQHPYKKIAKVADLNIPTQHLIMTIIKLYLLSQHHLQMINLNMSSIQSQMYLLTQKNTMKMVTILTPNILMPQLLPQTSLKRI